MSRWRFEEGDPCIKVTDEDLRAMSLDELIELGDAVGLGMEGVKSTEAARAIILKASKEIVNF